MGIPGLTRKAEQHAARVVYQRSVTQDRQAIIDGPALAYHILNLCISQRQQRKSPFDDVPTYQEIATSTVAWLAHLSRYGFEIKAIIFDGYLPSWKKSERSSRGQQSLTRLVTFRARRQDHELGYIGPPTLTLFDSATELSEKKLEQIAAPPCFINAILDQLFESKYHRITKVVPGEADSYCAELARDHHDAFVFTGDSDLLVYDLGPNGRVVIFKDVQFSAAGESQLQMLEHHPHGLAEILQVSDLICTAYNLKQNRNRSLLEAAAVVKLQSPTGQGFEDFRKLYTSHGEMPTMSPYLCDPQYQEIKSFLDRQDPRFSELVLQLQIKQINRINGSNLRGIYFFLPFLLEDPTKSSAFQASASLLKLAYSLLRLVDYDLGNVIEYGRRGLAIQSTAVMLHTLPQTFTVIDEIVTWTMDAQATYEFLPPPARWRMIAAAILLDHLEQSNKNKPRLNDIVALVLNNTWPQVTWGLLHARAQLQGVLFAFQLIKQIVCFTLLLTRRGEDEQNHIAVLASLQDVLSTLPKTANVLDWGDATVGMSKGDVEGVVESLTKLSRIEMKNITDDGFAMQQGKRNKKQKKQVLVKESAGLEKPAMQGKNQYSLLADM
ncbi:Hypothetical protein D9617_6g094040 [Elsinoe fawcettii]|nr:Hypothetical protein D9617_6g094040 [Elsinoe fawcettii]